MLRRAWAFTIANKIGWDAFRWFIADLVVRKVGGCAECLAHNNWGPTIGADRNAVIIPADQGPIKNQQYSGLH